MQAKVLSGARARPATDLPARSDEMPTAERVALDRSRAATLKCAKRTPRYLMRHQHRNRHALEQLPAEAAEQGFAQLRMVIAAADDQVGGKIGSS